MTIFYLDTSIAVHALRGTSVVEAWFDEVTRQADSGFVSSRILRTELTRVLRRDSRPVAERDVILRHLAIIPVTEAILTSAESITDRIKTLDAIHLASALALGSETVVATHDNNVKWTAGVLGPAAFDPIAG